MKVPIILLSGHAGSGKDTLAAFIAKNHGAAVIAQADPMKRLAARMFDFSEETLWGPSEMRNTPARRPLWNHAQVAWEWLQDVLPEPGVDYWAAVGRLQEWFDGLPANPTARHVLQTLGTEWGRAFSRNMWIDYALRTARELLSGGCTYDRTRGAVAGRDPANLVVITDGRFRNEVLGVHAAGGAAVKIHSSGAGLEGAAANHASEVEQMSIPQSWFDALIINDKALGLEALEHKASHLVRYLEGLTWTA